jgi:ribosomal protein S18 acetylase RimI-like enzyme
MVGDADLYRRGVATLLASWEAYATGASSAAVWRTPGAGIAVFPHEPERTFYNNAILERDLAADERRAALDAIEPAYGAADVTRFAAWVHEADAAMRAELDGRGYTPAESTRAMGMALDDLRPLPPRIELGPPDWSEYLRILDVPSGYLARADQRIYHVLVGRLDGENVAAAMAFDHAGDCGIYNVTTLEHARRRGLGTALTLLHLHGARARGCVTASLQSTPMAEHVYASAGFRDLGRIVEYVPPARLPERVSG